MKAMALTPPRWIPVAVLATLTSLSAPSALAQQAPANDQPALEEVIVTAQKRAESILNVPQSVTVVSSDVLTRNQAYDLQDYLALIPGLSLTGDTPGQSRISLRGVNSDGVASTVAVYVDDVPFGSSSGLANGAILAGDFDTTDVERLEVLRGPQGTLYGASSLGGVLKFVTKTPKTDAFDAFVNVGGETLDHGDPGYSATGMINIPFTDRIAFRASGFWHRDGGFIDSPGDDPIFFGPPALGLVILPGSLKLDNFNSDTKFGGRASLQWSLSDALQVRLTALTQDIRSGGADLFQINPETLQPIEGLTQELYNREPTDSSYRIYAASLDWNLGFASLFSSSSYSEFNQDFRRDYAFLAAVLATSLYGNPFAGQPFRPLSAFLKQTTFTHKITQELRLSSPTGAPLEWLVGGYYTRENSGINPQQIILTDAPTGQVATDLPVFADDKLDSDLKEYAGFANATWHVVPRFDLTFGGRYSHNAQHADITQGGTLNELEGSAPEITASSAEHVFTYSVAPRFQISDAASIYARVATGYRPGGPNVVPPGAPPGTPFFYKADRTTNYEVGLKSAWLDHRLSVDLTAFYISWKDIQLFAVINQTGVNTNGGTAFSRGVEFTAAARPTEGLTLTLNGAYTNAKLTEDTPAATGGFRGDPLPYIPDWSVYLSAAYEWHLADGLTPYVGASANYVGKQSADFAERFADGGLISLPTYEEYDVRAGLRRDHWSIEVYGKNLSGAQGLTEITGVPGASYPNNALAAALIRPRTVGVTLGWKF
ncbi:MAG TPA: TonB-dependent receptor [Steroidobacteraceae bacterium]|nr:TonB-dependent receptor [Steroidobacteraceae bacterium]